MTLGENIARLRAEKRLSQGDLAELLDVSRQSISKWETDASVPELDKLLRLAEIFGVTLDELVKGEAEKVAEEKQAEPQIIAYSTNENLHDKGKGNRIGGIVFLVLGMLVTVGLGLYGGGLIGLLFGMPFYVCAVICFVSRGRRTWLWCSWALYFCVDSYLRYGTGLNWRVVFQTFRWTAQMNYMRLFIGWCQFLVLVLLIAATLLSYRRYVPKCVRWTRIAIGWVVLVAMRVIPVWYERSILEQHGIEGYMELLGQAGWSLLENGLEYLRFGLFCYLLIQVHGTLRLKKKEKETDL